MPEPTNAGISQGQPAEGSSQAAEAVSMFEELRSKKGFKDNDSFAKSYTEVEKSYGKTQSAFNTARTNLETQSNGKLSLDENGNLIDKSTGQPYAGQQQQTDYTPPGTQYTGGSQYPGSGYQQPEPIYDPYTNQPITDPTTLAIYTKLPPGQREAFIFNALAEQREKQQSQAFMNEQEVLTSEEAKGFEQDVKKVMMSVPLQERTSKDRWTRALREVKGARYDQDKQTWSQQGVEGFLNKAQVQGLQGAGSQGSKSGGVELPPHLEEQYQMYLKERPGMFKDRAEFMKYSGPTGGR